MNEIIYFYKYVELIYCSEYFAVSLKLTNRTRIDAITISVYVYASFVNHPSVMILTINRSYYFNNKFRYNKNLTKQ